MLCPSTSMPRSNLRSCSSWKVNIESLNVFMPSSIRSICTLYILFLFITTRALSNIPSLRHSCTSVRLPLILLSNTFFLCSIHCIDSTNLSMLLSREGRTEVKYRLKGSENIFLLLMLEVVCFIPGKMKWVLSKCEDADERGKDGGRLWSLRSLRVIFVPQQCKTFRALKLVKCLSKEIQTMCVVKERCQTWSWFEVDDGSYYTFNPALVTLVPHMIKVSRCWHIEVDGEHKCNSSWSPIFLQQNKLKELKLDVCKWLKWKEEEEAMRSGGRLSPLTFGQSFTKNLITLSNSSLCIAISSSPSFVVIPLTLSFVKAVRSKKCSWEQAIVLHFLQALLASILSSSGSNAKIAHHNSLHKNGRPLGCPPSAGQPRWTLCIKIYSVYLFFQGRAIHTRSTRRRARRWREAF